MSWPPSDFPEPGAALRKMQSFIVEQLQQQRALPKLPNAAAGAAEYLTGNDRLSPAEQLEIYRVQFWLRHTSALLDDNPGVSGILGQQEWEALVESYFAACSPDSWTLRDLGKGLADHIAARPETPHQQLCVDMARLEWAYTEIFDAEDTAPIDVAALSEMPPEAWQSARMQINPALRLLRTQYPVAALRKQLRQAKLENTPAQIVIPEPAPQNLVLYRDAQRVLRFSELGDAAYLLLTLLTQGEPLVPACEQTASTYPTCAEELAAEVGRWFQDWGARGWIVGVRG